MAGALTHVVEAAFAELSGKREQYDQFVRELNANGLLAIQTTGGTMTTQGLFAKRTTPLGDRFLEFISSPTDPSHA